MACDDDLNGKGYTARMSSGGERLIGVDGYEVR
jgi:hypothetical protein